MLRDIKVFFSPEGTGGSTGMSGGLPPVEMPSEVSDKDILNQDDTDANEQVPGGKGKGKRKETVSDEEEKEDGGPGDEESDGTEDEDIEEEEETEEEDDEEDEDEDEDKDEEVDLADLTKAVKKLAPKLFTQIPGLREALESNKVYTEL